MPLFSTTSRALRGLLPFLIAAEISAQSPVTAQPVNNAEGVFRFAIVPDRNGGNRGEVFETAIAKLNLLQPEFVMCTGDLIDGYTTDPKVAAAQWDQFDALVKRLDMPFHYVPGNHDIGNPLLLEVWKQRHGPPWSSFVYQNVLFLTLHTEDRPLGGLGEEQIAWAKKTLAENSGVRWTMVFFHRPLWRDQNQAGFEQVRAALKGRNYTVFASHYHHYVKGTVDGMNYYVLATAGGASPLRGTEVGEFDHVMWVTMKPDGPVVVNLPLNGILPDDLVTEDTYGRIAALRTGSWLKIDPIVQPAPDFTRQEVALQLVNSADQPLRVRGSLSRTAGIDFLPSRVDRVVPPQQTLSVPVQLKPASGAASLHALNEAPLQVTLTGAYDMSGNAVMLPATQNLRFDWQHTAAAAPAPIKVDGDLADWPAELFTEVTRPMLIREDWDWSGPNDGRFRFAVAHQDGKIVVAFETFDDRLITAADASALQDRLIVKFHAASGTTTVEAVAGRSDPSVVVKATPTGLAGEFAFTLPEGEKTFRLNLGWMDHDRPESTKASVLWWREDRPEFGAFTVGP
ncbi:MAG TPA: metallophosphoesterase [Lacunisphaera sp.]|nr:metallophosphoesterase [Lacunisphaera sp.]